MKFRQLGRSGLVVSGVGLMKLIEVDSICIQPPQTLFDGDLDVPLTALPPTRRR